MKMLLRSCVLFCMFFYCFAQHGAGQSGSFFRHDYTFSKDFNAFYKVHKSPEKWFDAVTSCKGEGAELFVPSSEEELNMVTQAADHSRIWIAAHDIFSEGDFLTLDGKPFSEKYVKWNEGEPNSFGGVENCVVVEEGKEAYLDYSCDRIVKFVCKKSNVNITQNSICESHDTGYALNLQTNRCYKYHSEPLSWHLAFRTCRAEGSSLAIISSNYEAQLFIKMFSKYPEPNLKGRFEKNLIHIGFNDLLSNGIYLTIEGQTLSEAGYDNWNSNQPDNAGNNEHCGSMFRDGSLNDINCDARAMFVCEKTLLKSHTNHNQISIQRLPDEAYSK